MEQFISKNAPPPVTAPAVPRRRAKRAERWIGIPFEFVADVCQLTEGRAALVVALHIYRRTTVCDNYTVTLPSGELAELGIVRQDKQRALIQLQRAGLIDVNTSNGQTASITLLWRGRADQYL